MRSLASEEGIGSVVMNKNCSQTKKRINMLNPATPITCRRSSGRTFTTRANSNAASDHNGMSIQTESLT